MIILILDFKKCLNVVRIFFDNGVDINVCCSRGYLLIDYFKMVYLWYDEFVIKRGECFLGGNKNKFFVKKEKLYYGILMVIFIVFYILFCFNIVESVCFWKENSFKLNKIK